MKERECESFHCTTEIFAEQSGQNVGANGLVFVSLCSKLINSRLLNVQYMNEYWIPFKNREFIYRTQVKAQN